MTTSVENDPKVIARGRRAYGEPAMRIAATGSAVVILLMLAALLVVLFAAAVPSVRRFGAGFLLTSAWRPNELPVLKLDAHGKPIRDRRTGMKVVDHYEPARFGALTSLTGTAQTSVIALLLAVPLSLGAALYLVRIAPGWLITPVSFLIEFLAAIPSIAYGLWGMFVLSPWMGGPARWERTLGFLPIPAGIESRVASFFLHIPGLHWLAEQQINGKAVPIATTGRDVLAAGIILGIMIIPIITAISRDVLRNVPPPDRGDDRPGRDLVAELPGDAEIQPQRTFSARSFSVWPGRRGRPWRCSWSWAAPRPLPRRRSWPEPPWHPRLPASFPKRRPTISIAAR